MRALFSYGVALVILLIAAAWLGTGYLIQGGNGPGNGERPLVTLIEPKGGPVTEAIEHSGMKAELEHVEGAVDPHLTIAQRQEETLGASAPARSVRIQTFTAEARAIEVPLRGQTRAKATVSAVAETAGTVAKVEVVKGQTVKTGDLLCTLDQGTRQAAVAQAEASVAQAQATLSQAQADYDTNAELRAKGIAATNTGRQLEVALSAAKSAVAAAQAGLDNAREELGRTEIFAKSDGVVQDPLTTVGSVLPAGGVCATVVQMDPMIFTGAVPEARIGLARTGLEAKVTTITGDTLTGKVTYIASVADPATRAFPVEIEIPNPDGKLRAGVTATATVNLGTAVSQLLPQSVLTLDDEGTLGIRAVEDSKVVFYPVTIVSDSREGVWVTGLPNKLDVITVGQEFVQAGQVVDARHADGA